MAKVLIHATVTLDGFMAGVGGSISRQCLKLGLVDEIVLDVEPLLLGEGISLFCGARGAD